jgi:hypothetical protein
MCFLKEVKKVKKMNKKVAILTTVLLAAIMLTSVLSTVQACSCNKPKPKLNTIDFVFYLENVVRVDDNVRWWFNTGESGTGTPPLQPPDGATKEVDKGYQFMIQGEGTYLQLGETQIPIAPENYKCTYDVVAKFDVEFPVIAKLTYFVQEKITFNAPGFHGFLNINSIEKGDVIANPQSPIGRDLDISGTCSGYGMINGRFVTLNGDRHLLAVFPGTVIENSGTIKFLTWW